MGVRTGREFIDSLKDGRRVFIDGRLVEDVTSFAPLKGIISTLAELFDAQHGPQHGNILTYVSPQTGNRVSRVYHPAKTLTEFQDLMRCEYMRTDATYGTVGRLNDFVAGFLLDTAAGLRFLKRDEAAERTEKYIAYCRENDLVVTHTLIDPQSDRSSADVPAEAVHAVKRTKEGIVVRGSRLLSTLAPVANECLVGPFMPRKPGEEKYCLTFAVPMNAPGLKIIARESYDRGLGSFNRPLSSRFDEGDGIMIFDDVFVPTERILIDEDLEAYNEAPRLGPGYTVLQAAIRSTAKLRFLTGLATVAASVTGRAKSPRHQEMVGELTGYLCVAEVLLQGLCVQGANCVAAQEQGAPFPITAGDSEPRFQINGGFPAVSLFFPWINTVATDYVRMIAGSGPITMTEADYNNPEIKPLLDRLLIGPGFDAGKRLQLMKLVWDATGDQFGSRQALYERLYAGDPIKNRIAMFGLPKRSEAEAMVERLLGWER